MMRAAHPRAAAWSLRLPSTPQRTVLGESKESPGRMSYPMSYPSHNSSTLHSRLRRLVARVAWRNK